MNWKRETLSAGRWLAVLTLLGAVAWGADEEPWTAPARSARKANPVTPDDQSLAAGKALYAKQCLSCHGATGTGNGPAAKDLQKNPGDLSKPKMWEQTDGTIFWKITTGRKPMPSFETLTTEQERWEIVNYMRTLAPKPAASSIPPSK
jgi:mono/diheme cytochrome c family protein